TNSPELENFASALAALAPTAGRLRRDQLLFRAGQASVSRGKWIWPASTALLAIVSAGLGIIAWRPPEVRWQERVVYVHEAAPPGGAVELGGGMHPGSPRSFEMAASAIESDGQSSSPISWYPLEQAALRWGVDGIPDPGPATSPGSSAAQPQRPVDL